MDLQASLSPTGILRRVASRGEHGKLLADQREPAAEQLLLQDRCSLALQTRAIGSTVGPNPAEHAARTLQAVPHQHLANHWRNPGEKTANPTNSFRKRRMNRSRLHYFVRHNSASKKHSEKNYFVRLSPCVSGETTKQEQHFSKLICHRGI